MKYAAAADRSGRPWRQPRRWWKAASAGEALQEEKAVILENEALRLLPADTALAPRAAAYYVRNRAFLRPFEPERPPAFLRRRGSGISCCGRCWMRRAAAHTAFYIEPKCASGLLIGSVGLNNVVWGAFCSAFLGYKLDAVYTGRGCMTEAVRLVVEYAFTQFGLHRIEANVMPRNAASLRVVEKKTGSSRRALPGNI